MWVSEDYEPPSKCARLGCSRPRQYPLGCAWDHCCKLCFSSSFDGERCWEHEPWCHPVSYVEVASAERRERRRRLAIQQYIRGMRRRKQRHIIIAIGALPWLCSRGCGHQRRWVNGRRELPPATSCRFQSNYLQRLRSDRLKRANVASRTQ